MFPFHFCSQPVCVLESQRLIIWKLLWRFAHPNRSGQKHPDAWASCMPTRLTLSPSHLLILIRLLLKNIFLKNKWILFPIVFYLLLQISYSFLFDIWNFLLQISAKKKKKHKPLSYSGVSVSLAQNCFLSPRWVASAADNPRLFTGLLRSESILSHSSASQRTQYNSSHMAGAQKMFLDCRRSSPLNIWRCYQVSPSLLRLKILGSFNCFVYSKHSSLNTFQLEEGVLRALPTLALWSLRQSLRTRQAYLYSSGLLQLPAVSPSGDSSKLTGSPNFNVFTEALSQGSLILHLCKLSIEMKSRVSHLFLLTFTLL